LFLTATAILSNMATISAAFVGFHIFIFLTIGGVSMYARQSVERALAAERRAEMEAQRAESEGRIKKMFASIAHELNNATTGMAALMPFVIEHGGSDRFLAQSLNAMQWNILDIQRIANQLRLLAKNGDITLEKAVFPLRPLIDNMVTEAESWVAQHGRDIAISVCCDADLYIYANEFWIGLYLRTLLKNCLEAIDQSGGVGAISVRVEQCAGVAITIADTGPGFPPDKLGQLNDHDSGIGTNKAAGTGIGIPFMKMVALLHDARIVFANKNGRGAIVELHLQGNEP
jgi:signal transduction histidine kinase